ncbi:uncharacterized protein LOC114757662 [Neltuma alba]|uniref:uncharacterized protein LOC114757662 n=1 Tax=Neltuma alba TaxID=207710 RepID=UPI0010A54FE9|nr:uncharacterized protein LOC114757662 [Prosopis alba]
MSVRENENPSPALTLEEHDALDRSHKKVRAGETIFSLEQRLVPRVEEWMTDDNQARATESDKGKTPSTASTTWKSFKEAVTKEITMEEEEEDWWSNDRRKERISVSMTVNGPNMIILPQEKERLALRWQNTLIVKLLGRMINPDYFENKLKQLWAKQGDIDSIDVGSGFFAVKFSNASDYELALTGGLWLLFDHYIAVQPWKLDFDPDEEQVSKIAAWIRIPKLALDYYDRGILHVLGNQVGKVLKVDTATHKRKKGRFARICVELDLSAPLRSMVLINGEVHRIQYEGIHLICFSCGRYSHDKDLCPQKRVEVPEAKIIVPKTTQIDPASAGNSEESYAMTSEIKKEKAARRQVHLRRFTTLGWWSRGQGDNDDQNS